MPHFCHMQRMDILKFINKIVFFFSYQICEFMYEREHHYDKIIDCYLRDPLRKVRKRWCLTSYYLQGKEVSSGFFVPLFSADMFKRGW